MAMNEQVIVTVYVVIDDTLKTMGHSTDKRAVVSDAEVATFVQTVRDSVQTQK